MNDFVAGVWKSFFLRLYTDVVDYEHLQRLLATTYSAFRLFQFYVKYFQSR